MTDWVTYPFSVTYWVSIGIYGVLIAYLSTFKNKSAETKTLIAWLSAFSVAWILNNLVFSTTAASWDGLWVSLTMLSIANAFAFHVTFTLLVLLAYQWGQIRYPREQRWVTTAFAAIVLVNLAMEVVGVHVSSVATVVIPLFNMWAVIIALRKWHTARGATGEYPASAYLAFASIIVIPVLLPLLVGIPLEWAGLVGARGLLGMWTVSVVPILVVLIVLQFTPERSSLGAKFVGVGFLVLVVAMQVRVVSVATERDVSYDYMPTLESKSLVFQSTPDSGYTVIGAPATFLDLEGEVLPKGDDDTHAIAAPFPVSFFGSSYDSIWVAIDGMVGFEAGAPVVDDSTGFFVHDHPIIAAFRTNLTTDQHGDVIVSSSTDSLVITWRDVASFYESRLYPWDPDERVFNAQLVLRSDSSFQINWGYMSYRPMAWEFGISPGMASIPATRIPKAGWRGRNGQLQAAHLPLSVAPGELLWYGERNREQGRAYWTALSLDILKMAAWLFGAVIILIPVYFRFSVQERLDQLMTGLRRVQDGDLDEEIPVVVNDEVGQMSEAFNNMTGSLRRYSNEMELLVEQRTAELKSTQAQLVEQEKLAALGSLTAGIAHEIKNPLNFVNNFAEVGAELSDELAEAIAAGDTEEAAGILDELKANAEQIAKHGRRADDIVKAMMQHARGGTSEKETVSVNAFLEEYANLAWHGMRARDHGANIELVRDFDADAGTMSVLPQELGRVVLNLLNNAFDAVRNEEGATVTIGSQKADTGVRITVSDNGSGIPDDLREKIFEPFFTTKATGEGTGLGLSLSYDIVTQGHGGTMTVGSSSAGGAAFVIELPA